MTSRTVEQHPSGSLARAELLLAEGIGALEVGRLTEAVSRLRAGLHEVGWKSPRADGSDRDRRLEDPGAETLAARLLLSLAFPTWELGHRAEARSALADAARIATRAADKEIEVLVHGQLGAILLRAGQVHDSLLELDLAVSMLDRAPAIDQCKIMINRGELNGHLGRVPQAKADCRRALALAQELGEADLEFYATHNLGVFEYLSGNLPRALELMPDPGAATSDFAAGVVCIDRAKVLLSAGMVAEAERSLVAACEALARTDLPQFLAEAELERAEVALLSGNHELARTASRVAVARLRRRQNRRAEALGRLVLLRAESAAGARAALVVRTADRLAAQLTTLGLHEQASLAKLIAFDHARGSSRRSRSVPRIGSTQSVAVRLHSRLVRAKIAFAAHDVIGGRRQARIGLSELTEHQSQFGSLDLQASSAAHGVELAALAITEEMAHGRPSAVLAWLERARAIYARVPEVHPPADPETAMLLSQLRWVVNQIEQNESAGTSTDALRQRRADLQSTIRARSWTQQGPGLVSDIPRTGAIRAALDHAHLVTIFDLHGRLNAIVLGQRQCWLRHLGPTAPADRLLRRINADLDVLALDRVPTLLRASARSALTHGLAALNDLLIAPLDLPDGPVVLLPPGKLAGLPWAALPAFASRPLTVAPSAAAWLRAHAGAQHPASTVVAVAGPGLERAEEEIAAVVRAWPAHAVLSGAAATGDAVLAAVDGARLLHVAAHGTHERDSPLFSSIKLHDGPLVGYDLDRLRRPPQQVVLSACDLGQATVRPGDEALGLTRALLHSGTSTVISGVAKVSDRGAADLMVDYHRRLATGSPPAYALADSLAATDEPMPFVCFGAGW